MGRRPIGVEQAAEHNGAQHVAGREGKDVPADRVRGDGVEVGEDEGVGEEDGVVEEGLRGHQREAHQ